MGKFWGNLYYVRNIIYYRVSSYEQRAFPNFWRESFKNLLYETRRHSLYIVPPGILYYLVYRWGVEERERLVRKDPTLND